MPIYITNSPSSKWIEVIAALNELTQKGRLKWQDRGAPPPAATGLIASAFTGQRTSYYTSYQDKWFRLTRTESAMLMGDASLVLDIVDSSGTSVFQIPETSGLSDLYKSVMYNLSGVDNLIDALLSERRSLGP